MNKTVRPKTIKMPRKLMITWPLFLMILASVSLSALAQIMLKYGMSDRSIQQVIAAGGVVPIAIAVITSLKVWLGLFLYGSSAVIWLFVLATIDVSVAYPFVALGFLLTMAMGCTLLGEAFTLRKLCGTALTALSILLVAGRS